MREPGEFRPRKRFGQHFLHDPGVVRRIVDAIDPRPDDTLVEIGPGLGVLTRPLLSRSGTLDVVEIDRDLAARLEESFGPESGLRVHRADALVFDFPSLGHSDGRLRVVGNLPYNVSTPLLFHLLAAAEHIQDMVFMLQREVAERLAAVPGGRDYGRLSVMTQACCTVALLFRVGPGAFRPPPQVSSAVVRLVPNPARPRGARARGLMEVTRSAFAQRRKTLRNALQDVMTVPQLTGIGIDPSARAETLSVADFLRMADLLLETRGDAL